MAHKGHPSTYPRFGFCEGAYIDALGNISRMRPHHILMIYALSLHQAFDLDMQDIQQENDDPENTVLVTSLRKHFEYLKDIADRRVERFQQYLNEDVALRAKLFSRESVKRKDEENPAHIAFDILTKNFDENLSEEHQLLLSDTQYDDAARAEVNVVLREVGINALTATGSGEKIFSDQDRAKLLERFTDAAEYGLKNTLKVKEALQSAIIGDMTEEKIDEILEQEYTLIDGVLDLPDQTFSEISILLDVALQNPDYEIFFFDPKKSAVEGHPIRTRPFIYLSAGAIHQSGINKRILLPTEIHISPYISISEEFGKPLEGMFAITNDVRREVIPHTSTLPYVWKEELLHRTLEIMFSSDSLPFPSGDNDLRQRFSNAMIADLTRTNFIKDLSGYLFPLKLDHSKDLVDYITMGSPKFDKRIFDVVAKEFIIDVILMADREKTWSGAEEKAPETASYIKEVILPLARQLAVSNEIELTHPQPSELGDLSRTVGRLGAGVRQK